MSLQVIERLLICFMGNSWFTNMDMQSGGRFVLSRYNGYEELVHELELMFEFEGVVDGSKVWKVILH